MPIWSEPDYTAVTAFGEVFPGDVPHPTWWAVVGTAPPDTTIDVTVDDERVSDPPVHRLADLWACEWIAHPAVVRVHRSDDHQVAPIRIGATGFSSAGAVPGVGDRQLKETVRMVGLGLAQPGSHSTPHAIPCRAVPCHQYPT
ncbi:hypothetical protein [Rhodococcus gordoniae]|uniref:hypothetical protein n=1 Tax=Rhodococcus gordoniae TaxID=223392 RepID=UPI0020CE1916|nr:hypothetical protein [Rhodococcus gordoniae]UTT51161.1 hypothetical protein NMQ04_22955 [Rhodococcus gordoniae]